MTNSETVYRMQIAEFVRGAVPMHYVPRVHDVPMPAREALSWIHDWKRRGYDPIVIEDNGGYRIYGHDTDNCPCALDDEAE